MTAGWGSFRPPDNDIILFVPGVVESGGGRHHDGGDEEIELIHGGIGQAKAIDGDSSQGRIVRHHSRNGV
eukprot:CAMPEP_0194446836 /NCGR_PEP_ID=MMETSP0176-20130528/128667_1 /TAXON_ID=216777 /ORGANISM="Proboscia alata, Strain PI-D3" /LENGTH=69 /DNA_ID=CAMNT_0039273609 /DNA_START=301 /DNA_END=511 /DNA_ORIENTATION=+